MKFYQVHMTRKTALGPPMESGDIDETKLHCLVLADQVKSLDWHFCKANFLCKLPAATTAKILENHGALLIETNEQSNAEIEKFPLKQN